MQGKIWDCILEQKETNISGETDKIQMKVYFR